MVKLTTNETRYSQGKRPVKGQTVVFLPAHKLTDNFFELYNPSSPKFIPPHIKIGTDCVVVSNSKFLTEVQFKGQEQTDLVSPEFLVKRYLTQAAKDAMEYLRSKVN